MTSVREILLAPKLTPERAMTLLAPYGFRDPRRADKDLQSLAEDPQARRLLAEILDELLTAASDSADPDGAVSRFERFVRASGSAARVFSHLQGDPRMIRILLCVFGASPFLAEILIRHPGWVYWLSEPEALARPRGADDVWSEVKAALLPLHAESPRFAALRTAKRREILHVGVRDVLRLATVEETLRALSSAAEALVEAALLVAVTGLRESLRLPPPAASLPPPGFVVLGLGKLGGQELNFSSDVDLIYVYDTDRGRVGQGRDAVPRARFHELLARRLTAALSEVTAEGYVYRVDLRLRPEGRSGSVALAAPAFASYYRTRGAVWERLALLKAWPVAGDRELGARCLERTRGFVFSRPFAEPGLAEVRRMKAQIDQKIAAHGEAERHVKLGIGGIREIELFVQMLQVRFGRARPALRPRGTLLALDALRDEDLLAPAEHRVLHKAYLFLRDVENKLQMVSDAQVHVLSEDPEEVRRCALRLGYRDQHGIAAGEALIGDYRRHTEAVHRLFERALAP